MFCCLQTTELFFLSFISFKRVHVEYVRADVCVCVWRALSRTPVFAIALCAYTQSQQTNKQIFGYLEPHRIGTKRWTEERKKNQTNDDAWRIKTGGKDRIKKRKTYRHKQSWKPIGPVYAVPVYDVIIVFIQIVRVAVIVGAVSMDCPPPPLLLPTSLSLRCRPVPK